MRTTLAALLALALMSPALAHRLNVFASVEGSEVLVEAKFSTGRIPVSGTVTVSDAVENELATFELRPDGTLRFPLDRAAAADGLSIVVTTSGDHEGYWILTPDDIAKADESEGVGMKDAAEATDATAEAAADNGDAK